MNETRHINDLVDLIVSASYDFYKWKCLAAIDRRDLLPDDYFTYDRQEMEFIMARADDLLKTAQQTRKIQAQSANDIIKLLAKGKVTIAEAEKLLKIIDKKDEMNFEF